MDVKLTPELEKWVQDRLATGMYTSESEVVREALRLMQRQEELYDNQRRELRAELEEGIEQLDRGEGRSFDSSAVADIKRAGRYR
jgi:antitoxin ParD1/3/4